MGTRRHRHGALAIAVDLIQVGTGRHQLACYLIEALHDGKMERSDPMVCVRVDIGAAAQEDGDESAVSLLGFRSQGACFLARLWLLSLYSLW